MTGKVKVKDIKAQDKPLDKSVRHSHRMMLDASICTRKRYKTAIGNFNLGRSSETIEYAVRAKLCKMSGSASDALGIEAAAKLIAETAALAEHDVLVVSVSVAGMQKQEFEFPYTMDLDEARLKALDLMLDRVDHAKSLLLDKRMMLESTQPAVTRVQRVLAND